MAIRCVVAKVVASRVGTTMLVGNAKGSITFPSLLMQRRDKRNYSVKSSTLDPSDVGRLAETARISLTPQEAEEIGPKIQQVVEWFGQLQGVDLESIEPAIRPDIDGDNLREDIPQTFENRNAIIAAIPNFEEPYIKEPQWQDVDKIRF